MLKVIDYLKKSNSEVPKILGEVQHIEQDQKFSDLKRHRRFDSDNEREKNTELFSAIRNGNLQKVQELLKAGVKANIIDKNNKDNTPLHYAVEKDKKEIAEELLQEWKPDINAKNNKGDTPLHIAVSKVNKELVQLLLSKQAKTDIKNDAGKTPLSLATDIDDSNPNKQSIIQMFDQPQQRDNKRKYDQSSSDPNKRQKFDQDNSSQFAERTLNQQDYQVWLTQEDIANIVKVKYGWYGEDSNVIFEVIGSVEQLGKQLTRQNIDNLTTSNKKSLTFIINLNGNHWVTLIIFHQNQKFSAYYINSFGDGTTSGILNELNSAIPGIQVNNPKFKQQEDDYNCGIFALENASIEQTKSVKSERNTQI
ncbi:ankyrin repeat domain-containing protein [Wolbachia endosymbiont (group A) of Rhorus exstirpatorius]|uniref:ankyrin repeat domain-containing protein n=1 Tax=Wolbachia endosymbiont (group A) of Rhorus exstirpatorius TaxID=3066213 RepID=UPI00334093C5